MQPLMPPLVTAVIPVWDQHAQLLPRCLESLATEQVPIEILIIDNASTVPLEASHPARRLTLPTRHTIGAARNAGLHLITTPFVIFADADDQVAEGSVARSVELLVRKPNSPGVLGRSIVDECGHGRRRGRTPRSRFLRASRYAPGLTPFFWLAAFQCSITSTVLRTGTVRGAGGFADADIGEDWLLAARLSRRGAFLCVTEPVRIYFRHAAAARIASDRRPSSSALQRMICTDCLADPVATPLQRLFASAILRARPHRNEFPPGTK